MRQYALVRNGQIEATEYFKRPELAPDGWLPIEVVERTFNAATEYLGALFYEIRADSVVQSREIIAKTDNTIASEVALAKTKKLAALANRRWQATQFFQFEGIKAPADSAMQAITSVAVAVNLGLRSASETIVWKLADGEFRHWSLQQLFGYANAVQDHIQTCFNREALLSGLIKDADTIEDIESVNIEDGWPD